MYKTCETCEHNSFCKTKLKCDTCGRWEGWIPVKEAVPEIDEYVLIQFTEEYAGSVDNITTGIYFPGNYLNNEKPKWCKGHILVEEAEDNEIYAWRPLPKPLKEN